jgi:hypothetical protein
MEWFGVIGKVLYDPAIQLGIVYNMDEIDVMPGMLISGEVSMGKDDLRGHRSASVKHTLVTAIKCISANGEKLSPLII